MLAERMGIPAGEAMRQVAHVIAGTEDPVVEETIVLSAGPVPAPEPVLEPDPARASVG
jgi:hypothetical protein